jgi:hypothetical protein
VNTVGTFGFSSAGYWWGRLAAMVVRGSHYLLSYLLMTWMLLFADDGKVLMPISKFRKIAPALFSFFGILGFPIKWAKVKGGTQFQWIGYWNDLDHYRLGISERRQSWLVGWITAVLEERDTVADFDSALGRLSFVCGAILYDRPFLAPLFSLAAITRKKTGGKVDLRRLPPYVKFILLHLGERLKNRPSIHCLRGRPKMGGVIERFRSDAKAEGDIVTVGGYQTGTAEGAEIPQKEAKWFLLELTRSSAPWAFAKGEPFRTIASLELLGSLLGIMLLLDPGDGQEGMHLGRLSVGALTDNSGNRFAVARMLTTKWPLVAFLAELSAQLEKKDLLFEMSWVPREQNAEADAITNGDVQWLCPAKRVATEMNSLPFLILHELLSKGAVFYEGIDTVNVAAAVPQSKDIRTLRVRDPWD